MATKIGLTVLWLLPMFVWSDTDMVCNKSNSTGATCGIANSNPSEAPEFITGFLLILCCSIFSFPCNVFVDRCVSFCLF